MFASNCSLYWILIQNRPKVYIMDLSCFKSKLKPKDHRSVARIGYLSSKKIAHAPTITYNPLKTRFFSPFTSILRVFVINNFTLSHLPEHPKFQLVRKWVGLQGQHVNFLEYPAMQPTSSSSVP